MGEIGDGIKKKKKKNQQNPHRHREKYGDYLRERGWRQVEEGKGGINVDRKRPNFGLGIHRTVYR